MRRVIGVFLGVLGVLATAAVAAQAATLNVRNASASEATRSLTFTVKLSSSSADPVTFSYATADGSAKAPADYAATMGTATIPPGALSAQVSVPLVHDRLDEDRETFLLDLSSPSGASIGIGRATGRILDADPAPAVRVAPAAVREGDPAVVTVSFAQPSGKATVLGFATHDGSAVNRRDFTATSGVLTIPAGSTTATTSIPTVEDRFHEPTEAFFVVFSRGPSPPLRSLGVAGQVRILDDDPRPRLGGLSVRQPFARFTLSRPAVVRFHLELLDSGRWVVARALRRSGRAGANRVHLGRLAPGRYRMEAVAVDAGGARSFVRRAGFRISG